MGTKIRKVNIRFEPIGKTIRMPVGSTVLDAALGCGAQVPSPCGGCGICGGCRVIAHGGISLSTAQEKHHLSPSEIRKGSRLACQTKITTSAVITTLSPATDVITPIMHHTPRTKVQIAPRTKKIYLALRPPCLRDQRCDVNRILDAITKVSDFRLQTPDSKHNGSNSKFKIQNSKLSDAFALKIPLSLYQKLPSIVHTSNFRITAVICGDRLLDIEPGDTTDHLTGAAIDVGTTTVSLRLYDLFSGAMLAEHLRPNPQGRHGADVASRITFAENTHGTQILQRLILHQLNTVLAAAARQAGRKVNEIYDITVVGNPTMMHLLIGVNPQHLARTPFTPCFSGTVELRASEIGLKVHPEASIRILPGVSAYVGADAVGAALSSGLADAREPTLLIDMGTNAEILLLTSEGIAACSAAAGPALEGAHISCGTHARLGAVRHFEILKSQESGVRSQESKLKYSTIGGAPPMGLCGSAILDLIAELRRTGAINANGRLAQDGILPNYSFLKKRIKKKAGRNIFLIARANETSVGCDLVLTQHDIRQFQLAKSAILTGVQALLKKRGIKIGEIKRIYLAGLLGSSLNAASAVAAGILPLVDTRRVNYIGNAAIEGAALALLSEPMWEKTKKIAGKIRYIELSNLKDFQNRFTENLFFP